MAGEREEAMTFLRGLLLLHLVCLATSMGRTRTSERGRSRGGIPTEVRLIDREAIWERRRVVLKCEEDLTLVEHPNWTKDGRPLDPSHDRIDINAENVTIRQIQPEDEGVYCCDGGNGFQLTTPPHVIHSDAVVSVTHDMGSPLRLECGVSLGPVSRREAYEVTWQRVFRPGSSIIIISSCMHTGPGAGDVASEQEDCSSNSNISDFSLTLRDVDPDPSGQAQFKCIVNLNFQPTSSQFAPESRDADTVVSFYEPAAISPSLLPYTVTHHGDTLALQIGISGDPLQQTQWEKNGEPLPRSLSDDTCCKSSLSLAAGSVNQGDTVRATLSVLNVSSDSSETKIIILYPLEAVSVARPSECRAPLLRLSLPSPIPIPHDPSSPQPIQLHVEYTRIDRKLGRTGTPDEPGIVNKPYNASVLTQSSQLEVSLENLPYTVLSWEAYVVRVKLQVLGELSRQWSAYSRPFCIQCSDCLNEPSVKINLRLSFTPHSSPCRNMELEAVRESLVEKIVVAIQRSCPEYLCRDLALSEVELSCSGESAGLLTARASGIGTQENIRSFLKSISEQEQPLRLSVNGTTVEVSSVFQQQETQDTVPEIAGSSAGASLAVLLLLLTVALTYTIWRRKKSQVGSGHPTDVSPTSHTSQPAADTPPPHRDLGLPQDQGDESPLPVNVHLSPPLPPPAEPGRRKLHHFHSPLPGNGSPPHHVTPSPRSLPQSPLTMTQAADLARMEENLDDSSSVDTSSAYAPHSEISFMSAGSGSARPSPHTPCPSKRSVYGDSPLLPQSLSGQRSRHNMFLPLSQSSRRTPCSCSCHSRESTPLVSPSPSTSLLGSSPFQRRGSPMPRPKTTSPSLSPSLVGSQSPFSQNHYQLWTNRATSPSPQPHLHLPRRQGASESPV